MEDRSYNLGGKTCGGCTRSVKDYKAVTVQTREAVNRWISKQISSNIHNVYCLLSTSVSTRHVHLAVSTYIYVFVYLESWWRRLWRWPGRTTGWRPPTRRAWLLTSLSTSAVSRSALHSSYTTMMVMQRWKVKVCNEGNCLLIFDRYLYIRYQRICNNPIHRKILSSAVL